MKNAPTSVVAGSKASSQTDRKQTVEATPDRSKGAAVREGVQAADEGRTVPQNSVKAWLESWGTDEELPPPGCA